MKKQHKPLLIVAMAAAVLLSSTGGAVRAESATPDIQVQVLPTYQDPFQTLLNLLGFGQSRSLFAITVPPGSSITPAGLAIDPAGNLYVSDYGYSPFEGSIIILPQDGRSPLRVLTDIDRPSDIEISPDGRRLLIAGPDGSFDFRYLGVSIRALHGARLPADTVATISTDDGPVTVELSDDGYFHFLNVLTPNQHSRTFDLIIQYGGITYSFFEQPFNTVNGYVAGQTVMDIAF